MGSIIIPFENDYGVFELLCWGHKERKATQYSPPEYAYIELEAVYKEDEDSNLIEVDWEDLPGLGLSERKINEIMYDFVDERRL